MEKLKLVAPFDEKPVKFTVEVPAQVYRHLVAYAELLGREGAQTVEPAKLVAPMIAKFIQHDRAFQRLLKLSQRPLDSA